MHCNIGDTVHLRTMFLPPNKVLLSNHTHTNYHLLHMQYLCLHILTHFLHTNKPYMPTKPPTIPKPHQSTHDFYKMVFVLFALRVVDFVVLFAALFQIQLLFVLFLLFLGFLANLLFAVVFLLFS